MVVTTGLLEVVVADETTEYVVEVLLLLIGVIELIVLVRASLEEVVDSAGLLDFELVDSSGLLEVAELVVLVQISFEDVVDSAGLLLVVVLTAVGLLVVLLFTGVELELVLLV